MQSKLQWTNSLFKLSHTSVCKRLYNYTKDNSVWLKTRENRTIFTATTEQRIALFMYFIILSTNVAIIVCSVKFPGTGCVTIWCVRSHVIASNMLAL